MNRPGDLLTRDEAIQFLNAQLEGDTLSEDQRKRVEEMLATLLAEAAREAAARKSVRINASGRVEPVSETWRRLGVPRRP